MHLTRWVHQCNVVSVLQVASLHQHGRYLFRPLMKLKTGQWAQDRSLSSHKHTHDCFCCGLYFNVIIIRHISSLWLLDAPHNLGKTYTRLYSHHQYSFYTVHIGCPLFEMRNHIFSILGAINYGWIFAILKKHHLHITSCSLEGGE